jgi:hypothetical protein
VVKSNNLGYMGLNLESIKNEKGVREDEHIYPGYDWITKGMLHFFDV